MVLLRLNQFTLKKPQNRLWTCPGLYRADSDLRETCLKPENDLIVRNEQFLALGLDPITLKEGLLEEVVDVAKKFAYRVDRSRVPAVSAWTRDIANTINRDPEGKALKSVS